MIGIPNPWLTIFPAASGRISSIGDLSSGIFRLSTDPIGIVNLTFDGVDADSEIRIYRNLTGEELAGIESCVANQILTVNYYGPGQTSIIRIIHTVYGILEIPYTIPNVNQIIPIQQRKDRWYNNPV